MKREFDYYIGFIISIFFSVRYLIAYGIHVKSILGVAMIQIVFQIFYAAWNKVRIQNKKILVCCVGLGVIFVILGKYFLMSDGFIIFGAMIAVLALLSLIINWFCEMVI